jgi:iron complex outermembrane receptor protein
MFKRKSVNLAALLALGAISAPVLAQQAAPAQQLERVEVTGSRIKSINVDSVSAVQIVGSKDIKIDGVRNVESMLNSLPQVFSDQGSTVVNGSTGTAAVNLRGLGSDRTLVLVNGRRMTMGSPSNTSPDINQIPAGLIKRVEVLTGGASAVYGSDAVSGVVNFILETNFEGLKLDLNHSFFNHKQQGSAGIADIVRGRAATNAAEFKVPGNKSRDGQSTDFSMLMGSNFANNKGNATLFFSYKKDDALLQSERDFSACSLGSSAAGFACGGSGTNATGRITALNNGNRVFTNADANGTARAFANATDQYNFGPLNYFQRPSDRYAFHATGRYDINDMAKVYGEFAFHDDQTIAQIAPGGAFGSVHTARFDNPLLSNSWKAALGLAKAGDTANFVLQRRNVEGGGRQSEFRNTSFRSVIGVKGDVGPWSYDAFLIAGKVIYSQSENNYFLNDRIDRAMDVVNVNGVATCASVVSGVDPACVPYNPWKGGGVTQAQLNYLQTPGFRKGSTELRAQGLSVSVDLGEYGIKLPTANNGIGLALGAEHRYEALTLSTDPNTAAGALSGSGGPTPPLSGNSTVTDLFTEVRIPILERLPMADLLQATAAYRNSKYDKVTVDTYGLGLEYSPVKMAKLRGSYQQAVRAANLVELFQAQGNNLFDMDEDPCAGATPTASLAQCQRTGVTAAQYGTIQDSPAGQYNFLAGGNPNLSPEKGKSTTFGVVLQPMRDLTASIDYFQIKVDNTIGIVDPTTTLSRCLATGDQRFCSQITRDRLGTLWLFDAGRIIGTNVNIGSTQTSGWDFALGYNYRIAELGAIDFSFRGTLLKELITEEIKGEGSYDCVGYYGPNKCGSPNPEWRHKARMTWTTPWDVELSATWRYFGKVELQNTSSQPLLAGGSNPVDRVLKAQNYIDFGASYTFAKGMSVSLGINNLLDKDPPVTSQLAVGQGNGNTYPGVYDALGRKIFVNLSAKF